MLMQGGIRHMIYYDETNKNEAYEELKKRGVKSDRLIMEINKEIPQKEKVSGEPMLDVANYMRKNDLFLRYNN